MLIFTATRNKIAKIVDGFYSLLTNVIGMRGKRWADALQSFRLSDAPATGKFIQLADSENRFTERRARSVKSRVESALLWQTRRRLFIAHFLLLIRITYTEV